VVLGPQETAGEHIMKTYDLVIIGSGTAAQVASSRVRAADQREVVHA
jgi:pyruvate/2-oxoglutarate dehydrogenase complex dihydrolipoamide dehydrogenase (E3) component